MDNDADFHLSRARAERDIAYRSTHAVAADAHMRLSALHMHQALLLQAARRAPANNVHEFPRRQGTAECATPLPALYLPATR